MNHENSHLPLGILASVSVKSKDVTILMTMDVLRVEHRFYLDLVHFICLFSCLSVGVFECLAAGAGLGGIPVTWRHGPA